eukprot:2494740-Amphidinium_carterae.1
MGSSRNPREELFNAGALALACDAKGMGSSHREAVPVPQGDRTVCTDRGVLASSLAAYRAPRASTRAGIWPRASPWCRAGGSVRVCARDEDPGGVHGEGEWPRGSTDTGTQART